MHVILSRVRTWGSQIVIRRAIVSSYSWNNRMILSLKSHPKYCRAFDSILHYREHMKVCKGLCWSKKFADPSSACCSIPLCRPLSWCLPNGAISERPYATKTVWEIVRFSSNLMSSFGPCPLLMFCHQVLPFRAGSSPLHFTEWNPETWVFPLFCNIRLKWMWCFYLQTFRAKHQS